MRATPTIDLCDTYVRAAGALEGWPQGGVHPAPDTSAGRGLKGAGAAGVCSAQTRAGVCVCLCVCRCGVRRCKRQPLGPCTGQLMPQLLCCSIKAAVLPSPAVPQHPNMCMLVHPECSTALTDTPNPAHLPYIPVWLVCRSSSAALPCRPCRHPTGGPPASKPGLRSCLLMTWRYLCSTKTRPTRSGTVSAAGRATGIQVLGRGGAASRQHCVYMFSYHNVLTWQARRQH